MQYNFQFSLMMFFNSSLGLSMASNTNKGADVDDADFASTGLGLAVVGGEVELNNDWQMAHVQ